MSPYKFLTGLKAIGQYMMAAFGFPVAVATLRGVDHPMFTVCSWLVVVGAVISMQISFVLWIAGKALRTSKAER